MKTFFLSVFVLAMSLATSARADVILSIDLDTTVAGIQNTRDFNPGQTFTAALVLQVTGTSRVAAFSVGMNFDRTELTATAVDTSGRAAGFGQVNTASINQATGQVRPFDAISVGPVLENFTGNLGLVTFTATSPLSDGANDIIAAFQTTGDDILDGDTFLVIPRPQIILNGATVNVSAVPEPTSLLFATVFAGIGIQRVRRRWFRKQG